MEKGLITSGFLGAASLIGTLTHPLDTLLNALPGGDWGPLQSLLTSTCLGLFFPDAIGAPVSALVFVPALIIGIPLRWLSFGPGWFR